MLIIRKEQMRILEESRHQDFIRRTRHLLEKHFPHQCDKQIKPEDFESLIRQSCVTAEKYGITSENEVAKFIGFLLFVFPDLEQSVRLKARTILEGSIPEKMLQINYLLERSLSSGDSE